MQKFIMQPYRALVLRYGIFLFACVLAGCSALRLGYANGDTVTYWWLNSYIDINEEQKPWVRQDIERLFTWHRKTQLGDYAQYLEQVQQRLHHPVKPDDVMQDYAGIKKRSLVFIDKALPELTRLAMDLQPEQIAHLEKKFASNNEAYRKEYLKGNLEDRQLFRFKKVLKQAEYWFGNFTSEQEAQIRKASDARPLDNELWAEERRQRQQELLRILRKIQSDKPSKEAVSAMLRQYVERSFDNFTYAEHKDFFDGMRNGSANMVAVIANVATQEQREHARERLQKWIDDCRALAAK
ncbi:DUF6279 family lipoprotein [Noviherbaspirillum malthae]|uniref:DUF6279 family lipoprotein n=1 Tax=Noviherbaspirillum malthae TaxID=1260987 RepID=UPI001E38A7A7|nr:DUF6279 family lipoprotein [Noviherbaspirillum malthae]